MFDRQSFGSKMHPRSRIERGRGRGESERPSLERKHTKKTVRFPRVQRGICFGEDRGGIRSTIKFKESQSAAKRDMRRAGQGEKRTGLLRR